MGTLRTAKKQPAKDWHPADIVAALRKAGWSLSRLSIHHGYAARTTLKNALHKPWPKGERLIAEAIGIDPARIWPSRYASRKATQYSSDKESSTRRRRALVKDARAA